MTSAPVARRASGARLAVGLLLAAALTGCGANFQAQTYLERTVADGTNSAVGAIAIRNAQVLPPTDGGEVHEAGADAVVGFYLTNDGPEDDRLVEITSPDAASVQLVRREGLQQVDTIELPRLSTTGNRYGAVLQGLTEELRAGAYVELTLTFERNGSVDISVPAATTGVNDFEDRERSEYYHPIGEGEHGGEGGEESGEGGSTGSGGLSEAGEETTAEQQDGSSDH